MKSIIFQSISSMITIYCWMYIWSKEMKIDWRLPVGVACIYLQGYILGLKF